MINERVFKQVAICDHTHRILLLMQYKFANVGKKPTMAELIDKAVNLLDKEVNKE